MTVLQGNLRDDGLRRWGQLEGLVTRYAELKNTSAVRLPESWFEPS